MEKRVELIFKNFSKMIIVVIGRTHLNFFVKQKFEGGERFKEVVSVYLTVLLPPYGGYEFRMSLDPGLFIFF